VRALGGGGGGRRGGRRRRVVARLAGELVFGLRGTVQRAEGIYAEHAGRRSD
jgi:hypothetical protein